MRPEVFEPIPIVYRGLDASRNLMELRALSASLSGLGRILDSSIHFALTGQFLRTRKQPDVRFYARTPQPGCIQIDVVPLLTEHGLNLLSQAFAAIGPEVVQRLVSISILLPSGRSREVEPHFQALLELTDKIRQDSRAAQELLIHQKAQSEERFISLLKEFAAAQRHSVVQAVRPVGVTCTEAAVGESMAGGIVVDLPTAQTIRSKRPRQVGDASVFHVAVDGFTAHNRTARLFLDGDEDKPILADIVDPACEEYPNIYTRSIGVGRLDVTAKPTLEAGKVVRLAVIDARPSDVSSSGESASPSV